MGSGERRPAVGHGVIEGQPAFVVRLPYLVREVAVHRAQGQVGHEEAGVSQDESLGLSLFETTASFAGFL